MSSRLDLLPFSCRCVTGADSGRPGSLCELGTLIMAEEDLGSSTWRDARGRWFGSGAGSQFYGGSPSLPLPVV